MQLQAVAVTVGDYSPEIGVALRSPIELRREFNQVAAINRLDECISLLRLAAALSAHYDTKLMLVDT